MSCFKEFKFYRDKRQANKQTNTKSEGDQWKYNATVNEMRTTERTREIAWWVRALAALPDAADSVPSTHAGQLSIAITPASRNSDPL